MLSRVQEVLIAVLAAAAAAFVLLGLLGGPRVVLYSVYGVAMVVAVVFGAVGWSERRRERNRLAREHDLSTYDARMVIQLVDSGEVLRGALHPAARDYAQRQLDRGTVPVWRLVLAAALGMAVTVTFVVLSPTLVLTAIFWIAFAGYGFYSSYTRPNRLRRVLANVSPSTPQ